MQLFSFTYDIIEKIITIIANEGYYVFFSDELNQSNEKEVQEIKEFLNNFQVEYDYPDKTFIIRDNGKIIATGSASGNILKYFFSREEYKGQGAMGIIYNSLLNHLLENGYDSFFCIYHTK